MRQAVRKSMIVCTVLIGLAATVRAGTAAEAVLAALSPGAFKSRIDQGRGDPGVVELDIRTPKEYASGHIEGAVMVDYYAPDFVARPKALDRKKTYLIYCRSGNRTGRSLTIFQKLGFSRVYHLETGLVGWVKADFPLVTPPAS